jgi:thymidylate synthase (FAD)
MQAKTLVETIDDPRFIIKLCPYGTSANIPKAIWSSQHQCVIEGFTADDPPPSENKSEKAIIKNQIKPEHFSVLKFTFIKLDCAGFPRSMYEQIVRHKDSEFQPEPPEFWNPDFLTQSNRYTGDRFCRIARGELDVESGYFLRPVGLYKDREGRTFDYTEGKRQKDIARFLQNAKDYAEKCEDNCPYEMARGILPADVRINFCMAGTLEAMWHWLDQRSKKDAQLEIRVFSRMAQDAITPACPGLSNWYDQNRYGKARLAP